MASNDDARRRPAAIKDLLRDVTTVLLSVTLLMRVVRKPAVRVWSIEYGQDRNSSHGERVATARFFKRETAAAHGPPPPSLAPE